MQPWIAAARPKTLAAGLVPVLLGSALAFQQGGFQFGVFFCALFGALAIQVGTNYVNDASDFERGADTEDRLGPARMAASGLIKPRALYVGAGACFVLAFLFGLYLVAQAGIWILVIGLVSILFAVAYTAGPFPLAYLGLGDLFVLLFFGLVAVTGTAFAHLGTVGADAIYLSLACGCQGMTLIAINNLRDIPTDIRAGKKTLAVRLGDKISRVYVATVALLPFAFWWPIAAKMSGVVGLLPILSVPLALHIANSCIRIADRRGFNPLLAKAALLQLSFGVLAAISLVASR
jgi:1,4-dihydroxy-2-naphthoate octaprenyltransferase